MRKYTSCCYLDGTNWDIYPATSAKVNPNKTHLYSMRKGIIDCPVLMLLGTRSYIHVPIKHGTYAHLLFIRLTLIKNQHRLRTC